MSNKAKVMVAAIVAAISLGGLAPAAQAGLGRDIRRVEERDLPRVTSFVGETVRDTAHNGVHDGVRGALEILR